MKHITIEQLVKVVGGNWVPGSGGGAPVDAGALMNPPGLDPGIVKQPGTQYFERNNAGLTGVQKAINAVDRINGTVNSLNDIGEGLVNMRRPARGR